MQVSRCVHSTEGNGQAIKDQVCLSQSLCACKFNWARNHGGGQTGQLLQPLRWCCVDCVIYHERDVREEQHHTYPWREQAIIE